MGDRSPTSFRDKMGNSFISSDWYHPPLTFGNEYKLFMRHKYAASKKGVQVIKFSKFKWYFAGISEDGLYPHYVFRLRFWYLWWKTFFPNSL